MLFSLIITSTGVWGNSILYTGDDIAHLAYINELSAHFPPQNPGFSGVSLKGYHFFYDFLIAKFSSVSHLFHEQLYFQFFPLLTSLAWGLGTYSLLILWTKKKSAGLWGTFLFLFGGSFGFILTLQGHPNVNWDSVFGIDQPASSLLNPPFAFSVILLLTSLMLIYHYLKTQKKSLLIPLALTVGLTPMFKVYAGMIVLGAFLFFVFIEILKKRFVVILAFLGVLALFFGTFGIFVGGGQGLIFFPLWEPHKILTESLPWYGFEEKYYTYHKLSVLKGIFQIEFDGLVLFFLGNLGTRVFGIIAIIFYYLKGVKKPTFFPFLILLMSGISVLIPLFFIQTGKVFEIIQLSWYYPLLISLLAGIGLAYFFNLQIAKPIKILLIIILIVFTLPSAYRTFFVSVYPDITAHRQNLSNSYFQTMNFLKLQKNYDATVLEIPSQTASPSALETWYIRSSPHITAFANKRTYLNYEFILFPNLDIHPRIAFLKEILTLEAMDPKNKNYKLLKQNVEKQLLENRISFVYSGYKLQSFQNISFLKEVYANSDFVVYKVGN